jgi:hypothetical protein
MRPLFISLAIAILLAWIGYQLQDRYMQLATLAYALAVLLLALGVAVLFFG